MVRLYIVVGDKKRGTNYPEVGMNSTRNIKRVTVDRIISWSPCMRYTRKVITELFKGRKTSTAEQVAAFPIDADDRMWVLAHMMGSEKAMLCACEMASRAVRMKGVTPESDKKALLGLLRVGRAHANFKATDTQLHDAAAAACRMRRRRAQKSNTRMACSMVEEILIRRDWRDWWDAPWAASGAMSVIAANRVASQKEANKWAAAFQKSDKRLIETMVRWVNK
jgi:hypothetical protein